MRRLIVSLETPRRCAASAIETCIVIPSLALWASYEQIVVSSWVGVHRKPYAGLARFGCYCFESLDIEVSRG